MLFRRGRESARAFLPRDVSRSQQDNKINPASQMKSVEVMVILDSGFWMLDSRLTSIENLVSSIEYYIDYLLLSNYYFKIVCCQPLIVKGKQSMDVFHIEGPVRLSGSVRINGSKNASLPIMALQRGAYVVEINPQPTPLSSVADEVIRQPAATALPEWWQAWSSALEQQTASGR